MSAVKWVLDPAHSELSFKVRHMMISNVQGFFKNFSASFEAEGDDFKQAKINATVDVDSISTNQADRDTHLKSGDFFDAANFPQMLFEATKFDEIRKGNYKLTGNLTIKGIVKPIELDVESGGILKDPIYGNIKTGFTFTGKLSRKDWGLNWNAALETGGVLVSDDVRLFGELQFVKAQ